LDKGSEEKSKKGEELRRKRAVGERETKREGGEGRRKREMENVPERWDTRDLCRWLSSEGGLRAA